MYGCGLNSAVDCWGRNDKVSFDTRVPYWASCCVCAPNNST
jgi:hypothetical protein